MRDILGVLTACCFAALCVGFGARMQHKQDCVVDVRDANAAYPIIERWGYEDGYKAGLREGLEFAALAHGNGEGVCPFSAKRPDDVTQIRKCQCCGSCKCRVCTCRNKRRCCAKCNCRKDGE